MSVSQPSTTTPALSTERKKALRTIGHSLKPVVTVGSNGLSEAVLDEINRALNDHELIKVKLAVGDRDIKQQVTTAMCEQTNATLVQTIGNIALILREAKKPNPKLSNLLR